MTMHDRMMAVYRKEIPDRMPVSIYKRYLPTGETERLVRNLGLGISDYYPPVTLLAPPWHTSPGYVSEVKGADLQIRLSWENGQMVETRTYETPTGAVSQETTRDQNYGSDWVRKHFIQNADDYKVMQYIVENTVFRKNDQTLRARMSDLGNDGVVLGRLDRSPYQKLLMELAGPEQFFEDMATEPGPVLELMEAMTCRMDEAFEMFLETDVEVAWQPDNISGDMTPPDSFRKYCMPVYEKRGKRLREAGIPYVVHMDGRLNSLKSLIAGSAFDAVESFSLPMLGNDMTLAEAWESWPDKVVLPNFPSPLCLESDQKIKTFLEELFAQIGDARPFMWQVSEDIPPTEWQRVLPILCRAVAQRK
jgi:uroporphyrinogen-III decarboxylase